MSADDLDFDALDTDTILDLAELQETLPEAEFHARAAAAIAAAKNERPAGPAANPVPLPAAAQG